MRRQSLVVAFVALAALAAVVCAYFLGRAQAPHTEAGDVSAPVATDADRDDASATPLRRAANAAPLPARAMPLKRAFSELKARADGGDIAAATRLYRDLRLCSKLDGLDWFFSRTDEELLDEKIDTADRRAMEDYRVQLDGIEARKQVMQKYRGLCDGVDRKMLDSQLSVLLKAAQLGDADARACYLMRGPNYDPVGLMRHPEWVETYRRSAQSLIDSGLASGNWKVIDLLRSAYQPGSDDPLAGILRPDPALHYRYLRLYGLGADPNGNARVDRQLAAVAAQLTPEQRADGDLWAQTSFQRDFAGDGSAASMQVASDPCSLVFDPL